MTPKTLSIIIIAIVAIIALVAILGISMPQTFSFGNKIAVIKIEGAISNSPALFPTSFANPKEINELLENADNDPTIKAILIEINSPGGSPVASDEISKKIENVSKTTVAYIADSGTSGAYWVAASADKIVTHPLSITCSIGAFSTDVELSDFFKKIGFNSTTIKSGELKDIGSPYRPLTDREKELLQKLIDSVKADFIEHVKEHRNISSARIINEISDGRPCLGKEALSYGLVDKLGTKQDAIDLISEIEHIKKPQIVELNKKQELFSSLLSSAFANGFYAVGRGIGDSLVNSQDQIIT